MSAPVFRAALGTEALVKRATLAALAGMLAACWLQPFTAAFVGLGVFYLLLVIRPAGG